MPTYTLTSPQSGREYDVEFEREPSQADVDGIWPQLDAHYTAQAENKDVLFGMDTFSGIGQALGGVPTTLTAAYYRAMEGGKRPDQYSPEARAAFDEANAYQARMQQESQDRIMRGEATSSGEAFREAGPSLGTSLISMGANIGGRLVGKGAGAVAGLAAGAPTGPGAVGTAGLGAAAGETVTGMAASYYVTQRIAKNQFLDDAFRLIGEERTKKGEAWGEQEKQEAYEELLPLAEAAAQWEAAPEALGNAFTFGAGKYVLGIGKKTATQLAQNVWKTLGKKTAAAAGGLVGEGSTETVTQLGQAPLQAQAQAYAQGKPGWQQEQGPYARSGGTLQAAADVLPATIATNVLMLGAGGAVKGGVNLLQGRRDSAATTAPGQPVSQPGQPVSQPGQPVSQPSPLAGIAARGGRVDVPPLLPANTPVSTQPPANQTVPDAVPTPPQTLTGPDVQTGTVMPVPPPTAAAGAGAGVQVVSSGKPDGAAVETTVEFVEAADLAPLLQREVNADQTRDRANNRGSLEQIARIAVAPDPQLLGNSPVSSIGAPVVDDVVLAGNGRAEGLLKGYTDNTPGMQRYRASIELQAAQMGRDISTMQQPVMIRRVQRYVSGDRRSFVRESNPKYAALQETTAEAALLDAEALGDLSRLEFTENGTLTSAATQQVAMKLKEAQRGVNATTGGRPDVVEATRRVQLAALATLARQNNVEVSDLSAFLETDTGRRVLVEFTRAAPGLAALDADLGLGDVLLPALTVFNQGALAVQQRKFANINEWATNRNRELIRENVPVESEALIEVMVAATRKPSILRSLFELYLEAANNEQQQRQLSQGSADIFGETRANQAGRNLLTRVMAEQSDATAETSQGSDGQTAGEVAGTGFTNLDTSGRTAGFLNTEILAEGAALIQRGITDFTNWSRAMVQRFGAAIREFLAGIWQQITSPQTNAAQNVRLGMPQGTAPVTVGQGGFVASPFHKAGTPFQVKNQTLRTFLTGSPLPANLRAALDVTENERRAVDQQVAMISRDLQTAMTNTQKRTGQSEATILGLVEQAMTGQPGAMALVRQMDANLGERTRRARNILDDLSTVVAATLPVGPLSQTILANRGEWMQRGYAAFDPQSDWSYDTLMEKARAGQMVGGKDPAQILADARNYLRTQQPSITPAELEATMRDLMDRNTWQQALTTGTVRKQVGSLMQRKSIAPEIRALMGEETNVIHRLAKSASFQAQLIARHHGQVTMRTLGLATDLLRPQRGGIYTVQIPDEGYQWSGLGGLWTTPQLMEALRGTAGVLQDGSNLGGWLVKALKVLGNEAKLNRVALNPDSWLVNVLGGMTSMVQSGDVFAWSFIKRLRAAGRITGSSAARQNLTAQEALMDSYRDMLTRLVSSGVVGSSITLGDIEASIPRHLLQWVADNEVLDRSVGMAQGALMGQSMGRGLGLPGRAVGAAVGGLGGAVAGAQNIQKWRQKVAEFVMTKPDNLFRVTGWLTNYESALAGGLTTDQAAEYATERTLNTFPNYNALPAPLREASKLGLMGSFIAFQHEVYRNFYWNVRYMVQELGSSNAAEQARGLRRLGGLVTIGSLTLGGGLAALLAAGGASGADDERNRIYRRWFAAPWEKDAVLAFDTFTPETVSYYNTSYLLPQITIQELAQAAMESEAPDEAVQRIMGRLWEQFASGSVNLSPILAAVANQDRSGRPITNREGAVGVAERVDSAMQTILEPGASDKLTRVIYALREAKRRGRDFSVEEEVKRAFAVRAQTREWEPMIKGVYARFATRYRSVREDANRMLGENLPGAARRAVEEANTRITGLQRELAQFELDLKRLPPTRKTILAAKKEAQMGNLNLVRVRKDGERVESVP